MEVEIAATEIGEAAMADRMTRREWMRMGAGAMVAASLPVGAMAGQEVAPGRAQTGGPGQAGGPRSAEAIGGAGSLKAHAAARGIRMGCAVNMGLLGRNEAYRAELAEQFDLVVGENCMKWAPLRPTPTTYDFKEADALVSFAEEHGMAIRGHNLCWHEQLPSWFAATATKENARAILTDHIATVAGRYRGKIQSWDVVNEAIWIKDGRADGMRSSSPWFALLGPEYLEIAFRAARAADPHAKLTYNDYGIEYDTAEDQAKRAAVLGLVKRLKDGKVPIDAVGIQSHLKGTNAAKLGGGIAEFAEAVRKMKMEVYLTELDVDDDSLPEEPPAEQAMDVADVYTRYLNAMLRGPAVKSVLVWGLADGQSWLQAEKRRVKHPERPERPLLFAAAEGGGGYVPTPAFFATRAALDGAKKR